LPALPLRAIFAALADATPLRRQLLADFFAAFRCHYACFRFRCRTRFFSRYYYAIFAASAAAGFRPKLADATPPLPALRH
jgi:hypothetical protein